MIRALFISFLLLAVAVPATAELPPLELVQKSVKQKRSEDGDVRLDLRLTEAGETMQEWLVAGTFTYGEPLPGPSDTTLDKSSPTARRLVWIALSAEDPVAELAALSGFVSANTTDIQVQDAFVYVYGKNPTFRVYRDLQRIAGFDVVHDDHRWSVRVAWDESRVASLQVTRDGRTVIAARSTIARRPPRQD